MNDYEIIPCAFDNTATAVRGLVDERLSNWPIVYLLTGRKHLYVGETLKFQSRMLQHLSNPEKVSNLDTAHAIVDKTFNKSATLHLESKLINILYADGKYEILNRNNGVFDSNYYQREFYEDKFNEIVFHLKQTGIIDKPLREILNSDIYKYSPFKSLNDDQVLAVNKMFTSLKSSMTSSGNTRFVVEGAAGTGKTIVAIYFLKYLSSIKFSSPDDDIKSKDDFVLPLCEYGSRDYYLLKDLKLALVIPQESLRKSIANIFRKTQGLSSVKVLDPFELGNKHAESKFDLIIVDEAHRLSVRANQNSSMRNKLYKDINIKLFGNDDPSYTQLDWVYRLSNNSILLLDSHQNIRPMDLDDAQIENILEQSKAKKSHHLLRSQMRMHAPNEYFDFLDNVFKGREIKPVDLDDYDFRIFESVSEMQYEILKHERRFGLSRMAAGFAFPWRSKNNKDAYDICINDSHGLWEAKWNSVTKDWVNTPSSVHEVGSIYTLQGYDLNYAGIIIGNDIVWDAEVGRVVLKRENYYDKKGKENNPQLNKIFSDEDILNYVLNIYKVLLSRGIRGTYVYIVDVDLRNQFREALKTVSGANVDFVPAKYKVFLDSSKFPFKDFSTPFSHIQI
ncbi:DNA/RNA helicase domain-containing protein [Rothia sp. LK2588]|uniref:DNA/RNA helicase domain-containing protein n=1 Tax=Rothia sp. LK2588 TaxID=3114369 RepID=UPI0034CD0CE3